MIDRIKQTGAVRAVGGAIAWAESWLVPKLLRRRTFGAALFASLLAVVYWGLIASDRYVSEAHVIIQRTELAGGQAVDFGSIISGVSAVSRSDQLLLRDHLLSVDMLRKLDDKLQLRAHYSDGKRDMLSRLWSASETIEHFHRYFLTRVSVEFDEYAGVLVVRAQAYEPAMAQAITFMMVEEGERTMNELAHRLAQEQVGFLEKQLVQLNQRAMDARKAVLEFQNKKGLVSPVATIEGMTEVVSRLEAQLTELQARRTAMLGYLAPKAPAIVEIELQIDAIEKQIEREQARLAAPAGKALNRTVEEFQRLQMNAEFAQDVYKTALIALEKGRVEALRTLKKVSVLQSPTLPEYPLEPRRFYNIVVFVLITLLLAGLIHLLAAIIRDHKD